MRLRGMVLLIVGLGCASCARSKEEIQEEFDAIVAESNACNDASECVLASAGCPLGCAVPVNRAREAYVEEKARELIEDYERWWRGCAYECVAPRPLECIAGRCQEITSP
ncbi:hypothetical protein WMF31_27185 [Sorangium sp. So ce1036]|uniref:hypothetical protein n=1 Tax=Sorangium sp. So ce1036 TaxID=3133328 RepID=UPI003EFC931E